MADEIETLQRIPRYKLLIEAYLRRLPDDSPDRPETQSNNNNK